MGYPYIRPDSGGTARAAQVSSGKALLGIPPQLGGAMTELDNPASLG